MSKQSTQAEGFTLMELTLYVGIASIILVISSLFLSTLLQARIKNQSISEVNQQGLQVMQILTQTLRNAQSIVTPSIGLQDTSLSVDTYDITKNPTLIYLSDGVIMMQEGSGTAVPLTNPRVHASDLTFSNDSNVDTPGIIRSSFTLTQVSTQEDWDEFDVHRTFYMSVALKRP